MEKEESIKIYESLSRPPKSALKVIEAGDLKGKSDINPQWRYKVMTETFGLIGYGWKFEIKRLWTEPGANGEILAFAEIAVFVKIADKWSDPIVGIGGSKLLNNFKTGAKSNDEGYKMAVTDALSTSLKMLGVAADIYAGKWDGSKYINEPNDTEKKDNKLIQNMVNVIKKALNEGVISDEKQIAEAENYINRADIKGITMVYNWLTGGTK